MELAELWGTQVRQEHYLGRTGPVLHPRPRQLCEMLHGTQRWADHEFLVHATTRISHGEFHAAIPAAASTLAATGVGPGSRVLLLSYNCPEFVLATWALWWLGAVPVYGNRWWSAAEIAHAVELTQPQLALTDAPELIPHGPAVRRIVELGTAFGTTATLPATPVDSEDQLALLLFTSGSSGLPKAVALSHRSVIANQHNLMIKTRRLPQDLPAAGPQAVRLVCTPLFHVGGAFNIVVCSLTGAKLVLNAGRFDAGAVLELIEAERVAAMAGVPTMALRMLEHPDFTKRDLSSLQSFPLGGAPLPPRLLDLLAEKLPQLARGLANSWGMTEAGGIITAAGNAELLERPGTVGRPYPCLELRVADPDAAGVGEIEVRGPTVMLGYLDRAGIDGDGAVDADGWFRTGDLGHLDAEGYLYLDGRAKDIVIRGGENIACGHVETALLSHPDLSEAAVFGVPHADLGEELVAVVRHSGRAPTVEELREHLRGRLAYFEVPTGWRIVEGALPTLAGEKVDKKSLRADYLAGR